jgi:hypothetical protein
MPGASPPRRRRNPLHHGRRLTVDEERTADFTARYLAHYRGLRQLVLRWWRARLTPDEKERWSVDDAMQDVALELLLRDHRWDPDRGRYFTFAALKAYTVLLKARDKRTQLVTAPANSFADLARLQAKLDRGEPLTDHERRQHACLITVHAETQIYVDNSSRRRFHRAEE